MNNARITIALPLEVFRLAQAQAAREGAILPVWVRRVLFSALQVSEQTQAASDAPAFRLTPTKHAFLTLLEKNGTLTTQALRDASHVAAQTVYNQIRDLSREGLIERGDNVKMNAGAGAPCKSWSITPLGREVLKSEHTSAQRTLEAMNTVAIESARAVGMLVPEASQAPHVTPDETYRPQVHGMLRYVAMALLGRAIESDIDLDWAKVKHAHLCTVADTDVREGKSTYAGFLEKVTAKVESLGGMGAIVERFNVG